MKNKGNKQGMLQNSFINKIKYQYYSLNNYKHNYRQKIIIILSKSNKNS